MPKTAYALATNVKRWMTTLLFAAILALSFLPTTASLFSVTPAAAQSTTGSPFGVPVQTDQSPSATQSGAERNVGPIASAWSWLMRQQQAVNKQLSQGVRNFKTMDPFSAALILAMISFTYGVLHAAGPGHGKAVISSYVLANEQTVKRGILLSFMAAGIQALSAIAIVGVLAIGLNQTGLQIKAAENWITTLSWLFVAAIGIWLLTSQLWKLWQRRQSRTHNPDHQHGHTHAHHHSECSGDHGRGHGQSHGHTHQHGHSHDHKHDDGVCPSCGHAHMPDPEQISGPWSWGKALAVALAVGIRPCTGAIIVMIFALTQGLFWAGVFATFAMAIGTAITVSALAALAVGSRELATRLADRGSGAWAMRVQTAAGLAGAGLITVFGITFFLASLSPQAPF
ncbi:MAG: nickel/cobalt transporter [Pseudomonadota bacterium]